MQSLQQESRANKRKTRNNFQSRLINSLWWILIILGVASLTASIISLSQILAFIGLGLVFWGAILLFIQPEDHTKKVLLTAAIPPALETLNQIIKELGYRGKAIYLPPKYFKNPGTTKIYLPKRQNEKIPDPNIILKQENKLFLNDKKGILFTPPGAQLTKLFEKRLGIYFTYTDLDYFKKDLPKLFIDDLEIAENVEIDIKTNESSTQEFFPNYGTIHIKITDSIFKDTYTENNNLSEIYSTIGSPISSAIACALTKVTGKPLIIKDTQLSENGKIIQITYHIEKLESNEQPETQLIKPIESFISHPLFLNRISLIFMIFGFLTLVWIGLITWMDLTVFGKNLGNVLFDYRPAEEAISLGIGMNVISYYMLGLALLFLGIIPSQKRSKKIIEWLVRPPIFWKLLSLSLIIFSCILLIWISEVALYELIIWNKNIDFILFTTRTDGQLILGLDMKMIYYFVIGSILMFLGLLTLRYSNRFSDRFGSPSVD